MIERALCGVAVLAMLGMAVASLSASESPWLKGWRKANPVWRGVHVIVHSDADLGDLGKQVPALAKLGVNVLVVEVDYSFQYRKRPEMSAASGVSAQGAGVFARLCRANGIRAIPQINCLGHQSWAGSTDALLTKHPEFDETPGQYPGNKGIYCRSWCPQNPEVYKVVFDLIDELVDAFQADAFHVGMDEVFLIASEYCPRCKGGDPAKLFARAVSTLHRHIVKKRRLEMLMWGDRLLDGKATGYGDWEAATNGTAPAIDLVPKDIVMCDWHYEKRAEYPSLKLFVDKGFRVWPSGWKNLDGVEALIRCSQAVVSPRAIGYLCTTWGAAKIDALALWPPLVKASELWGALDKKDGRP